MSTKHTILHFLNFLTCHQKYIHLCILLQPTYILSLLKKIKTRTLDKTH